MKDNMFGKAHYLPDFGRDCVMINLSREDWKKHDIKRTYPLKCIDGDLTMTAYKENNRIYRPKVRDRFINL